MFSHILTCKRLLPKIRYHRGFSSCKPSLVSLPPKSQTLSKFDFQSQTHTIDTISQSLEQHLEKKVTLHGWINVKPRKISKKLIFGELRDSDGSVTQLLAKDDDILDLIKSASVEDSICVTGTVQRRRPKKGGTEVDGNKWDLILEDYSILNKSNDVPSQLLELTNNEEYPPQLRYLQLRQKLYQDALKARALASNTVRQTLNELKFTEIETPLLFKSTPEGAREFLVPTRREGQFYALPQSPQQYKQLLMASGVKRYFQIAKCFRDEDLRKDRQPEFTQVDMELLFSKPEDVQQVVTQVVKNVWQLVRGLKIFTLKGENLVQVDNDEMFSKLTYKDALEKYGIDKPDLRSSLKIENLTSQGYGISVKGDKAKEFPVFEVCVLRGAFNAGEKIPSQIFANQNYSNRKPVIVPIKTEQDLLTWTEKFDSLIDFAQDSDRQRLIKSMNLQQGDIIAGSTRATLTYENPTPVGKFRQLAIEDFPSKWRRKLLDSQGVELTEVDPSDVFVGSWVVDFPLFSPVEVSSDNQLDYPLYDYTKYTATHHPFTMCKLQDYDNLSLEPLKVHGEHYDLVINGVELGGGSRRIHDSQLQRYVFSEILQISDPDRLFGHLLAAFDTGCPPHSGLAIGFDRMCLMLINSASIRDVVAFPKSKIGADAVVGSPSNVDNTVLKLYHVQKI